MDDKEVEQYVTNIGREILRRLKSDPRYTMLYLEKAVFTPVYREGKLYGGLGLKLETNEYKHPYYLRVTFLGESYAVEIVSAKDNSILKSDEDVYDDNLLETIFDFI